MRTLVHPMLLATAFLHSLVFVIVLVKGDQEDLASDIQTHPGFVVALEEDPQDHHLSILADLGHETRRLNVKDVVSGDPKVRGSQVVLDVDDEDIHQLERELRREEVLNALALTYTGGSAPPEEQDNPDKCVSCSKLPAGASPEELGIDLGLVDDQGCLRLLYEDALELSVVIALCVCIALQLGLYIHCCAVSKPWEELLCCGPAGKYVKAQEAERKRQMKERRNRESTV